MKESSRWVWPTVAAAVLAAAVVLLAMGRNVWCVQGDLSPIATDIWSAHNSQHLFDAYTFTHMLHGVMFYGLFFVVLGRWVGPKPRLVAAVVLESAWEVLENTSFIIDKYRESTVSLDYYGDSVLNSVADIGACIVGYLIAMAIPAWSSAVGFAVVELLLVLWIKDSLVLNMIMLVYPLDAIKQWQMG